MGKKRVTLKGDTTPIEEQSSSKINVSEKTAQRMVRGIAHIQATYNNTLVSITDERGNMIGWSSAGSLGYSGTRKAPPFVAARVAEAAVAKIRKTGIQEIIVKVSGVGSGRDSAIRALANQGLQIISIKDITPLPHNGPRPKKVRRV